ncbi:hypothetical protein MY10362_003661 [Beauveria mimosiformis]
MTRPRGLASRAFPCLLFLFLLAAPSALALDASFDFYPKSARSCLSTAAESSACTGETGKELNTCLCSNGGHFVEKVIRCLPQDDKNELLGDVFTTMDGACYTSGTPLSWKWSDWVDTAKSAKSSSSSSSSSSTETTSTETSSTETSSTTSTKSTSTTLTTATASSASSGSSSPSSSNATTTATNSPTSSPSPSPGDDSSSNLSTTATIGIAAGVSIAGVSAVAALAFFLVRKRKRASRPPMTYSMLTPEKYNGAGGGAATSYPPRGPSPSNLGGGGGGGGGGGHGGAAGFDSEVNETPVYTVPTYVSKSQRKQSYTALSSTSPDSALEQQKQQPNFLSGWEPPTHAPQYAGPYHPPQTGPVELPPRPASNVFELDAHGVVAAAPQPAQPALQPIAERQQESRIYRPYMPT